MALIPNNPKFIKQIRGRTVASASVLGGFPVLVVGGINPSEPEVGYSGRWVDSCDMEVFTLRGAPATFLEKKLTKDDWDVLEVALLEQDAKEAF